MSFSTWELRHAIEGPGYRGAYEFYNELVDGQTQMVERFGYATKVAEGRECDDGNPQWLVFKVADRLFRKEGCYSSWEGSEWDGELEEVEPVQVQVTKYRTI